VPAGSIGGSVWSSIATSTSAATSGCPPATSVTDDQHLPARNQIGNSLSIVHLSSSLKLLQAWQAPGTAGHGHDWDFGSSPTLFGGSGTPPDVGAWQQERDVLRLADNPLGTSPLWSTRSGRRRAAG